MHDDIEDDAPTGEEEMPDFDPTSTDPMGEYAEYSVVAAGAGSAGEIGYDELGQPRWTWITETEAGTGRSIEDTFDYLKALENESLAVTDDRPGERRKASKDSGYDPYDTARIKMKGRFPGR